MRYLSIIAFVLILSMLCLPSVSANIPSLGQFVTNDIIQLKQSAPNTTYCNITSIYMASPRYLLLSSNQTIMQQVGMEFNSTFINTSINGDYVYCMACGIDGTNTPLCESFTINPTGSILSGSSASIYIIIFIFSLLLFVGLLIVGIALPVKNKSDEMTGYIIAVNNLKYLKVFCLALSYLIAIFISYFAWQMSSAYLTFGAAEGIFKFVFFFLLAVLLPLFIVGVYVVIANSVRDMKILDLLQRGIRTKG